jgi:hypothetical protein
MKRTALWTLAVVAGWVGTAAAQAPGPVDPAKDTQKNQAEERLRTPSGSQVGAQKATGQRFVDADGNGVCDNCTGRGAGKGRAEAQGRQGRGPGDGTGRQGVRTRDGSGRGGGAAAGGGCRGGGRGSRGGRGGGRR